MDPYYKYKRNFPLLLNVIYNKGMSTKIVMQNNQNISAENHVTIWNDIQATPDQSSNTALLEKPEEKELPLKDDGGNSDRYAHYVSKDKMLKSQITGRPVVALCGKVWIPKHNAKDYPICPECKHIYNQMMNMGR